MPLKGFQSVPWGYSSAPKPRTDGGAGRPYSGGTAVSNLLHAPELVPMGQPAEKPVQVQQPAQSR